MKWATKYSPWNVV